MEERSRQKQGDSRLGVPVDEKMKLRGYVKKKIVLANLENKSLAGLVSILIESIFVKNI